MARRGAHVQSVFDPDGKMGESTCVSCGACVQACPTGALMPKASIVSHEFEAKVDLRCPCCGGSIPAPWLECGNGLPDAEDAKDSQRTQKEDRN